jgi:uncharacterized radical SAM protein YgiQ
MEKQYQLTDWLPTTKKELEIRAWDEVDVVLFSGDAYIDHPSFGAAVVGRILESEGLRVAIVPQPNWRDDLRDFKKMGRPRMFFAVSAGSMDSMVNHYTANKRLRSDDAYSPEGKAGFRPDYTTITYCNILKKLYPDVPVVIGGIEASLRRFTHYDYWQDKLMPSILFDSKADLLVYGMGEQPLRELASLNPSQAGKLSINEFMEKIKDIPQVAYLTKIPPLGSEEALVLYSHEECLKDKRKSAENFKTIEEESNKQNAKTLLQKINNKTLVVNPPFPKMTTEELDKSFDLPYTRLPHPKYKGKQIPAFEMIKFSVNIHRGCFGGCAFCTISAHQGKQIVSRSEKSILQEIEKINKMPGFKGYLSDLGGPSANMYKMQGKDNSVCEKCKKPSCIFPDVCKNLNSNHQPLLDLYKKVDALPYIKKSFVGSGVRYDLCLHETNDSETNITNIRYVKELIANHVSGRLKVAPEHTSPKVLNTMRKPSFGKFLAFKKIFDKTNREQGLNQQLIPYFISSHPNCTEEDMAELAVITKSLDFRLEQVQDFTPTPMTLATEMYYSGYNPYTLEKVYTAKSKDEKQNQQKYFFWYKREYKNLILNSLRKMKREDLIKKIF